jgi:hypothetical protein
VSHPRCAALLRCARCGRTLAVSRAELSGCVSAGPPKCCAEEMGFYIAAQRPRPGAAQVVAPPVALPDADEDTAVVPDLPPRARPG